MELNRTAARHDNGRYDLASWRRLRRSVLIHEPLCRSCQAMATCVDHIQPLSAGGTDELANLQPLCQACHSRKTAREQARGGVDS